MRRLESDTPSESHLWDVEAKVLLGTHYAFAVNDEARVIRETWLPPRPAVGFQAWLRARWQ